VPNPRPYPTCIFCGSRADSREHAIPAWMSRRLKIKVFLEAVDVSNITPKKQPVSFASHRARIFCAACNRHFKHLEDSVIPYVVQMAKGRGIGLDAESQRVIALWATKTAFALVSATAPELRNFVPEAQRRRVRDEGLPPDDAWVGFLPWAGRTHVMVGDHDVVDHDVNPARQFQTYGIVFTFAKLAFKVVGCVDSMPDDYAIDGDMPSIKQFWPKKTDLILWPPAGPPADDTDIRLIISFAPYRKVHRPRSTQDRPSSSSPT
jgi:hypothetical protein